MPKPKPRLAVNLRRMYVDCRHGQLHVHSAFPSSGGFDEEMTLIAVHGDGETGRSLRDFAHELGHDRSVYMPDLPGVGESDPIGVIAALSDQVGALEDFADQMRFRQVDLFGRAEGAAVAAEFALARPRLVRKLLLADASPDVVARLAGARPYKDLPAIASAAMLARAAREYLDT